jgi:hypothetical protein
MDMDPERGGGNLEAIMVDKLNLVVYEGTREGRRKGQVKEESGGE